MLIFPNLAAGNIAYKLVERLGGAKAVGPLLMGLSKPFNVLQRNTDMENVVNVMAITVAQAQNQKEGHGHDREALEFMVWLNYLVTIFIAIKNVIQFLSEDMFFIDFARPPF